MNFIAQKTKVFAIPLLIFVSFCSAAAQRGSVYRLPAGTRIRLSMDAGISSKISSVNDTFTTSVAKAVVVDDVVVLPFGTVIEGRVTGVTGAGVGGKHGSMDVRFETIRFTDTLRRTIDGSLVNQLRPRTSNATSIFSIVGGTAAGLLIGAASGSGSKSILAGAGIGAGAGTAVALLKKGRDVSIKTNEEFEIELKREVTLPVTDY